MSDPRSRARSSSDPASTARLGRLVAPGLVLAALQTWLVVETSSSASSLAPGDGAQHHGFLLLQLVALAGVLVLLWRLALVARYRPAPTLADAQLPSVTVVVPAYNEGRQVFETLRTLAASDYPREKLQIIAVDDGSADDTWLWMARGRALFPELITAVRCRQNRGKRAALCEGFERARGEILVTVDSDSEVLPDTLRNLVSPFADPRVGAVAGNVRVLNDGSLLGRMLDVSFTYAFEFMRASESAVDTVSCCPGALSAWRRAIVDTFRDEWAAQTFFGRPANIGEDRAMTNLVLRAGHLVRFQSNAIVLTEVPTRLPQLRRMLLRWGRSNVRETLALGAFVFFRFRAGPMAGARLNFVWATLQLLLRALLFVPSLALVALHPAALGWVLAGLLLGAAFPALVFAVARGGLRALWAFPYALFSALALSWIEPWSLLTAHRSGWLTRTLPRAAEEPAPRAAEEALADA